MSFDDVYALISDLLALPGKYSPEALKAARQHVEANLQGNDRVALLKILSIIEGMLEDRRRDGTARNGGVPERSDLELQEFAAILQDTDFLPKKSDLIDALTAVLGKDALRGSSKDSRDAVVRKAIVAFSTMPASKRGRAYKSLRTRFIRARGSSLKDWSNIISE